MLNCTAGSKRVHAETEQGDSEDLRDPFDGSPGNYRLISSRFYPRAYL